MLGIGCNKMFLRLILFLWTFDATLISVVVTDELPSCQAHDFHHEYTECDSEGGRWRVSVPKPGVCIGGAPNAPVRGKGCDFTCKPGEYLDVDTDQECHLCPAGHFSLGGGIRFEDFEDEIPNGFHTEAEGFSNLGAVSAMHFGGFEETNCTGEGWYAKDGALNAEIQDCTATLMYTANLVQAGTVSFEYQNEDEDLYFAFEIQNSQCQSEMDMENGGFLKNTKEGKGNKVTFSLKSGVNVLYWRAFKPTLTRSMAAPGHQQNKLIIKSIDIIGVAYTSACTQCKAGTKSLTGSSLCTECPANTYSLKGSSECKPCDPDTEYSESGSDKCQTKLACTARDYFEYNSPCNEKNTTQKLYKWIEPRLCRTDLSGAVSLPEAGPFEPCPPCNPGMEFINGSCHFCPPNHYSSGLGPCMDCPGSTAPQIGILYKWWNTLNNDYNLTTSCLSIDGDRGCATADVWIPAGDHIRIGQGHKDDVYLTLSLKVGGFKGREQLISGHPIGIAKISFLFELECDGDCRLTFMQRSPYAGINIIENWTGAQKQTLYEFDITKTRMTTFTWAFQKTSRPGNIVSTNMAKIYMINVTNTLQGGAQECKACPKGASQDGCIPCPDGNYVDHNTAHCVPCPEGKVAHGLNPWGIESCIECGSGLIPSDSRSSCVTSCLYENPAGNRYDYSPLSRILQLNGAKLFTPSGYKYFNEFHISVCGGNGKFPLAVCSSNASQSRYYSELKNSTTTGEIFETKNSTSVDDAPLEVRSFICRVTVIPTSNDGGPLLYTSHISLGDVLVAVTHKDDVYNISHNKLEARFLQSELGDSSHDVHFVYASDSITAACPKGLRTIITMRCDLTASNESQPILPSHCVTGTCDGCTYMLLWRSPYACPRCGSDNFTEFTEVCEGGRQKVLKMWPKDCYSDDGSTKEILREQDCSILWQDYWPIWLKAIVICVPVILLSGCILLIVVVHCWLKNRTLHYKYMKLVESSSGKGDDGDLPAAETCALDEGEDDEQFDAVEFKTKGRNILTKLGKLGRRKDKRYDEFHDVSTDHSSLLG